MSACGSTMTSDPKFIPSEAQTVVAHVGRNYAALLAPAAGIAALPTRQARMEAFAQLLWRALGHTGVSWVGFYVDRTDASAAERMMLAAREPGPACSPIGVHGACGKCLLSRTPLVVQDVRDLGPGYIACDPRDQSELVLPCMEASGVAWGVLDLDSHEKSSFSDTDAHEIAYLLRSAGLSALS